MSGNRRSTTIIFMIFSLLLLSACTAGGEIFTTETPADFWYGLWHGIISIITLIVHIFDNSVIVYEVNNNGGWYDFGFLLGVICIWGGGSHAKCKSSAEKRRDQEWDEIGEKAEKKIMLKLKQWAEDNDQDQDKAEWNDISDKVEKKLKRIIKEWAEKE